ncbi:MAG: hypothetical protein ACXWJB_13835 [Limisphaerales bacterium]
MKKSTIVLTVLAVLVALFGLFLYSAARGSHRARFVIAMNELREANVQLQKHGALTNQQFGYDKVFPCKNRFNIDGTAYQCQFAVESVDLYLRDRGLLTIATNDIIVWVDKKRGVMPLGSGSAFRFPPGL